MRLHPPSRLGTLGLAVLLSVPSVGVVAFGRPATASARKVLRATTTATRKVLDAGAIAQNITTGGPTTTLAPRAASASAVGVATIGTYTVAQLDQTFVDTSQIGRAHV